MNKTEESLCSKSPHFGGEIDNKHIKKYTVSQMVVRVIDKKKKKKKQNKEGVREW